MSHQKVDCKPWNDNHRVIRHGEPNPYLKTSSIKAGEWLRSILAGESATDANNAIMKMVDNAK